MSYKDLSKGEQFIFDWQYKKLGSTSFKGYLALAMAHSDNMNRTKLHKAFPEETEAMNNFQHKKGWWDRVEEIGNSLDNLVIVGDHHPQLNKARPEEK